MQGVLNADALESKNIKDDIFYTDITRKLDQGQKNRSDASERKWD